MKRWFKWLACICFIVILGGIGYFGYLWHCQQKQMESLCRTTQEQHDRIVELERAISSQKYEQLVSDFFRLQQQITSAQHGMAELKGSVENLAICIMGHYPCNSIQDRLAPNEYTALKESVDNLATCIFGHYPCNSIQDNLAPKEFTELKESVKNLAECLFGHYPCSDASDSLKATTLHWQLSETEPKGYDDLKDTVENLAKKIYGKYPLHSFSFSMLWESDREPLAEQVQELKRKLDNQIYYH